MASTNNQIEVQKQPEIDENIVKDILKTNYGFKNTRVEELGGYYDRNYKITVMDEDDNPHIPSLWPHGYVLKIMSETDSAKTKQIDAEHEVCRILHEAGVVCPQLALNMDANYVTRYLQHAVRLLTFIPGLVIMDVPYKPDLLYKAGKYIGYINKTLKEKNFRYLAEIYEPTLWNPASLPALNKCIHIIEDDHRRHLVTVIIERFKQQVLPKINLFQKGLIHCDFSEQNVLVKNTNHKRSEHLEEHEREYDIAGVIDFGDMIYSYYIFEVAITIMHLMLESKIVDINLVGGHILAGYLSEMELSDLEMSVLKTCIAGRYCQVLVLGQYSYIQNPGNEYVAGSTEGVNVSASLPYSRSLLQFF